MKKVLLVLTLGLGTLVSKAQLSVSKPENKGIIGEAGTISMNYIVKGNINDTLFLITYKNEKYEVLSDYKSLAFYSKGNTKNALYKVLKNAFKQTDKYTQELTLGTDKITLYKISNNTLYILTPGGYFSMNEQQLDELFGKQLNN
jgi:ferritin-like metal-binding protein YciE